MSWSLNAFAGKESFGFELVGHAGQLRVPFAQPAVTP